MLILPQQKPVSAMAVFHRFLFLLLTLRQQVWASLLTQPQQILASLLTQPQRWILLDVMLQLRRVGFVMGAKNACAVLGERRNAIEKRWVE